MDKTQQLIADIRRMKEQTEKGRDLPGAPKPESTPPPLTPQADLVRADMIHAKPITWLWPNWLPKGMLTLLGGYAGDGKSTLTMSLVAALSTGGALPDGARAPQINTLLLAAEDDLAHVVVPRLDAHKANRAKVAMLRGVKEGDNVQRSFNLRRDVPLLKQLVKQHQVSLVIIDPLSSYLAASDRNSEGEVRDTLQPLVQMMEETGVAVIGIMHIGKNDGQARAMQKLMGSTAFTALARSVWMVTDLPQEFQVEGQPKRKMIGVSKSNYSVPPAAIQFSRPLDGAIEYHGESPVGIEEVWSWRKKEEKEPTATDAAETWLLEFMDGKPVAASDVEKAAKTEGVSLATLKKVKVRLGLRSEKTASGWNWLPPVTQVEAA